ncbi:MAG: hypothetical protein V4621_06400 [Pseudomonadota bacterium]
MASVSIPFRRQAAPSPRKNSARKLYEVQQRGQHIIDFLEDQVNGGFGPDSLYFMPKYLKQRVLASDFDQGLDSLMAFHLKTFAASVERLPQDDLRQQCHSLMPLFANAQRTLHAQALQLTSHSVSQAYLERTCDPAYCLTPFLAPASSNMPSMPSLKPEWDAVTDDIVQRITLLQPPRKHAARQSRPNNPPPVAITSRRDHM